MLNVRPKDLENRAASMAPVERRVARGGPLRRVPPSWRTCRLTMSRAHFWGIVTAWIGGLALLAAIVLTVRWS